MEIKENFSLKNYNQFGVSVKAKYFARPKSVEEIKNIVTDPKLENEKKLILGGGNNILFIGDFDGLVIKPEIKGKIIYKKNDSQVFVRVGSGEDWDEVVRWTVEQDWGGIENLVMIPGTVGGALSQNIGAYGREISEVVEKVEAVNLKTGQKKIFDNQECQFSYRSSAFKDKLKNKYLISYIWFRLTPLLGGYKPSFEYASLKKELESQFNPPYSLDQIMKAVIAQRQKNLPDINRYGTCGCFFTNPVIERNKYQELIKLIPDLVCYSVDQNEGSVKIPAGKLIDQLGWKGKWQDNVGVSEKHALCIVTRRQSSGKEILDLANKIKQEVLDNYGVELGFEVNIV